MQTVILIGIFILLALLFKLIQKNALATPVTLRAFLEDDEGLRELGGPAYLARLAGAPISIHATYPKGKKGLPELRPAGIPPGLNETYFWTGPNGFASLTKNIIAPDEGLYCLELTFSFLSDPGQTCSTDVAVMMSSMVAKATTGFSVVTAMTSCLAILATTALKVAMATIPSTVVTVTPSWRAMREMT